MMYMISPLAWATISPRRNAVYIWKTLSRRNIKTSWSESAQRQRPIVAVEGSAHAGHAPPSPISQLARWG